MSTTALKLIALVTMVIDHIAEFIPGMPLWMRYIGRISAPLFFFCMAWGYHYTHNRKIYLIRMYLLNLGMLFIDLFIPWITHNDQPITNNIFSTMFIACVLISCCEYAKANPKKKRKVILLLFLWQIVPIILLILIDQIHPLNSYIVQILLTIVGSMITAEGNGMTVILILILYFCKENRKKLTIGYLTYCLCYVGLVVTDIVPNIYARLMNQAVFTKWELVVNYSQIIFYMLGIGTIFRAPSVYDAFFTWYFQWMMVFALPLMLWYNNKKGKGLKYLFYVFYPVHIVLLYWIGTSI